MEKTGKYNAKALGDLNQTRTLTGVNVNLSSSSK